VAGGVDGDRGLGDGSAHPSHDRERVDTVDQLPFAVA
jgi:hypothetical protein